MRKSCKMKNITNTSILTIAIALLLIIGFVSCQAEPNKDLGNSPASNLIEGVAERPLTEKEFENVMTVFAVSTSVTNVLQQDWIKNGDTDHTTGTQAKIDEKTGTIVLRFNSATTSYDFSSMGPIAYLGNQNVVVNGEMKITFKDLPSEFPLTITYNIKILYGGQNHTFEMTSTAEGISSITIEKIKGDGIELNKDWFNQYI